LKEIWEGLRGGKSQDEIVDVSFWERVEKAASWRGHL